MGVNRPGRAISRGPSVPGPVGPVAGNPELPLRGSPLDMGHRALDGVGGGHEVLVELGLAVEDLVGAQLGGLPEQALRDGDREGGGVDGRIPRELERRRQDLGRGRDPLATPSRSSSSPGRSGRSA